MAHKLYDTISNWVTNLFTKGQTSIPLFYITFDRRKYLKDGAAGSCICKLHPLFSEDEELEAIIKSAIDHIRSNYDMSDV